MKTILIVLVLSLGLLFLLPSCKKDREVAVYKGEYTLTGQVLDEITGQGIPYAAVGIIERRREWMSSVAGKTVAYGKADAYGNYKLSFYSNSEDNNYYLTASSNGYFERTDGGDVILFTKNGSKSQKVMLMPQAYISYRIKGSIDSLPYTSVYINGAGRFYNRNIYDHSILTDTVVTAYLIPNRNFNVTYTVSKGWWGTDVTTLYHVVETIMSPVPHDTVYYLIEF